MNDKELVFDGCGCHMFVRDAPPTGNFLVEKIRKYLDAIVRVSVRRNK